MKSLINIIKTFAFTPPYSCYLLLFIPVFFVALLSSCEDGAFFSKEINSTEEVIINQQFKTIEVRNIFEINLVQDSIARVFVTCGDDFHKMIDISVNDTILILNHRLKNDWMRKYQKIKLELHLNQDIIITLKAPVKLTNSDTLMLSEIKIINENEFSEINLTIKTNKFQIAMSPTNFGNYIFQGLSLNTIIYGCGSSFVDSRNLISQNSIVISKSIKDIFVNTYNKLTVRIDDIGNIYYCGQPEEIVIKEQLSTGKLIHISE
jgi:hypothetical protein